MDAVVHTMRDLIRITEGTGVSDPDFADWFGDSKVALRKGRPMTLFRGISASREERHPSASLGVFATADRGVAQAYAGKSGTVVAVHVSIQNPFVMNSRQIQDIKTSAEAKDLRQSLTQLGYDGIFVKPVAGSGAHPGAIAEYVAFEPAQVRRVG